MRRPNLDPPCSNTAASPTVSGDADTGLLAGGSSGAGGQPSAFGELTDPVATNSICYGSTAPGVTIAYEETDTDEASKGKPTYDDDGGFDEVAWWNDPASGNSVMDPGIASCFRAGDPDLRPAVTLSEGAATPPDDGFFDASATYIGAFTADDGWATGAWVSFEAR